MKSTEILRDLIAINTINDKENKKIINYIENYLQSLGFKTNYKSKCLIMSNKDVCNIGFMGHTDTVSSSNNWKTNPFVLTQKNNKLYGLGTCDMKGSIAVLLSVLPKINFNKNGIKLFFTFDEEIGFSGINELINNNTKFPNTMLIGEPTNNEIINASKGLLEFKFTFSGVSSHSSNPKEGINAICLCVDFINKLKKYYNTLKKETLNDKYLTMNIGIINGGRSINIIPDKCELFVDFRTINKKQNIDIINYIKKESQKNNIAFEIINNITPFVSNYNNINMSDYITEASFINSNNRYILGVGPNNAHKDNEYITIESLNLLEEQYINIIKNNC